MTAAEKKGGVGTHDRLLGRPAEGRQEVAPRATHQLTQEPLSDPGGGRGRGGRGVQVPAEPSRQLDIEGVEVDVADLIEQLGGAGVGQGKSGRWPAERGAPRGRLPIGRLGLRGDVPGDALGGTAGAASALVDIALTGPLLSSRMSDIAQAIADRQSEIDRLQAEIKALTDVEQILGPSAPPSPRSTSRRSSSTRKPAAASAAESKSDAKPERKRRPMTAAEKTAVSERMTAYWAKRRKQAAKK